MALYGCTHFSIIESFHIDPFKSLNKKATLIQY